MENFKRTYKSDMQASCQCAMMCNCPPYISMSHLDISVMIRSHMRRHARNAKQAINRRAADYVHVQRRIGELQWQRDKTEFWFITVNPCVGFQNLKKFRPLVEEFTRKFTSCIYTFEIRNGTKHNGLHAHILAYIPWARQNYNTLNKLKKFWTYRKVCGNDKAVDIKYIVEDDVQDTIDYMKKTRVSKSKLKSNKITLKWREKNKLRRIYDENGDLLLLV